MRRRTRLCVGAVREAVIPDDVRRFILMAVPSVPYLEAVLLMRRAGPASWGTAELARGLYLNDKAAAALLEQLLAAGVSAADPARAGNCLYAPSAELAAMIDRVAEVYASNLIGVSTLIHSTTGKKAQHFADAFRFRKDS